MFSRTILVTGLLSCLAIVLLVVLGLPPGHSAAFNYAWSTQYSEALSWRDPLPRYLPGLWAGFGGYDFFFDAPLPFWFIAALVGPICPGCSVATEFVLGASIFLVLSGLSMFAFLKAFFSTSPAAVGAAVYVILPYHLLIDWFERQAAGEFTAYAFIPLIALGMERIRRQEAGGRLLALGVAGTALSHLPTTLLAAHAFGVLVLVFVSLRPGGLVARLRLFARCAWFGMLGLAMASFYWLPAIVLLDTVSPAALLDPYFEAWRWLYGRGIPQPNTDFALRISVSFLACVPLLFGSLRSARGPLLAWILVPSACALFLNTAPSEPIWREWIIAKVQFPWRLMIFVDFSVGIAAAVLSARAIHRADRLLLAVGLMGIVVAAAFLSATVRYGYQGKPPEQRYRDWFAAAEYMSPEMTRALRHRLGKTEIGHFDQGAIADMIATMAAEFKDTQGNGELLDRQARSLTVLAPQDAAVLSLPVQYWFLWKAETVAGSALEIRANQRFGTLDIIGPVGGFGTDPVIVSLPRHPSEIQGGLASLLSALVLFVPLWIRRRKS